MPGSLQRLAWTSLQAPERSFTTTPWYDSAALSLRAAMLRGLTEPFTVSTFLHTAAAPALLLSLTSSAPTFHW